MICWRPGLFRAVLLISLFSVTAASAQVGSADEPKTTGTAASGSAPKGSAVPPDLQGIPLDRLRWHLPDPEVNRPQVEEALAKAEAEGDVARVRFVTSVLKRVSAINRPNKLMLTLEDALHRALKNNLAIEVQSYTPGIRTAQVVEAASVFDAVFFTDITKNKVDRPTGSQLASSDLDFFDSNYGIRKLLPSGALVTGAYGLRRTKTSLSFQQLNPEYFSDLSVELRQPLLRRFGLDYNRHFIVVAQNNQRISRYGFKREVRDILRSVEEAYWRLLQSRRSMVATARMLGSFEGILDVVVARSEYDAIPAQISSTRASWEFSRAVFIEELATVRNAEDRLIALMNSDDIDLADDTEIVPIDSPYLDRVAVDRLAESQTALDNRPELKEQEIAVANAKLEVGRALNEELPLLDVVFKYTVDGIGSNADKSFDEMSRHNFVEYFIGVQFELPIGNRSARAVSRQARLAHAQQVAALKQAFEEVLLDVNVTVRNLDTFYLQIRPLFESAEAKLDEVETTIARQVARDYNTLINELAAHQDLRRTRQDLLRRIIDYNLSITDLERAKGTLLRYFNVVLADPPS